MSNQTTQNSKPGFLGVLSFSAMAVPLLLVPAAFAAFDDAAARAQTIVAGLEWTVVACGIALALRALRRFAPAGGAVENLEEQAA